MVFFGMESLVAIGKDAIVTDKLSTLIDFVRLKRDSTLEVKKRQLPKRKKNKVVPNLPQMSFSENTKANTQQPLLINSSEIGRGAPTFSGDFKLAEIGGDREIAPIVRVRPIYPIRAAQRGIEGWVDVNFTISPTGTVQDPKVIKANPPGIFDRAALRAIRKWKYKPQIENNRPIATSGVLVRLRFDLEQG